MIVEIISHSHHLIINHSSFKRENDDESVTKRNEFMSIHICKDNM